ncbi:hypothetical protein [Sphingorhabdus sp.]|uniref:hypothetical protein n=1 Tax=Sphingorhabdus sp. TaxID=1902408 RepID=UPI00391C236B
MRGRAIGFVVLMCAGWTAARIIFTVLNYQHAITPAQNSRTEHIPPQRTHADLSEASSQESPQTNAAVAEPFYPNPKHLPILHIAKAVGETPAAAPNIVMLQNALPDQRSHIDPLAVPLFAPPPALAKPYGSRPFNIYAYSFWRLGDVAQGVLGNGQYGGSQSALIATIPLSGFSKERITRLAFTGRASVSHDRMPAREVAAGLQWRPAARFPVQLTIERRIRPNRADAFAAFVSGGHDGVALPLHFTLDGYGQAGVVTGNIGGGFVDGQLHALRHVGARGDMRLAAGAAAWGGGQSQIMRLDIGPSVRAILPVGSAKLRIDASWRFRVAGNAEPGDGPAVILSTSF